jgi:hypothetical protein
LLPKLPVAQTTGRDTLDDNPMTDEPHPTPPEADRPPQQPAPRAPAPASDDGVLQRLYSFRFTFGAIAVFILLYTLTIQSLERSLQHYFDEMVEAAMNITELDVPVAYQIQFRVDGHTKNSLWTSIGGVTVSSMILARDGATVLYVAGRPPGPAPARISRSQVIGQAERLLPASAFTNVSIPHTSLVAMSILVFYALITLQVLWIRNVRTSRRQRKLLERARAGRETSEARSQQIQRELEEMRHQLLSVEPSEPEHVSEVNELREERKGLEARLVSLEARELELRESASRTTELSQEISALEDLLEEASDDLAARDTEITDLQKSLRRAAKGAGSGQSGRQREPEVLARRLSTLYPNVEVDDRALQDIVALRDETMKLKCEEKLKRLNDEADNMAVRRKVGGLPPHLTIFEIGFAGKGRLYYTKGQTRRFRVLNVGAKNTQNAAIEYLRKL